MRPPRTTSPPGTKSDGRSATGGWRSRRRNCPRPISSSSTPRRIWRRSIARSPTCPRRPAAIPRSSPPGSLRPTRHAGRPTRSARTGRTTLNTLRRDREQRLDLQERTLAAERDLAVAETLAELLGPRGLQRDLIRDAERGIVAFANPILREVSGGELELRLLEAGEDEPDHALQLDAIVRTHGSTEPSRCRLHQRQPEVPRRRQPGPGDRPVRPGQPGAADRVGHHRRGLRQPRPPGTRRDDRATQRPEGPPGPDHPRLAPGGVRRGVPRRLPLRGHRRARPWPGRSTVRRGGFSVELFQEPSSRLGVPPTDPPRGPIDGRRREQGLEVRQGRPIVLPEVDVDRPEPAAGDQRPQLPSEPPGPLASHRRREPLVIGRDHSIRPENPMLGRDDPAPSLPPPSLHGRGAPS